MTTTTTPVEHPVLAVRPLGFPWETFDPFLFCVHHDDAYPEGNDVMGPKASLAGRNLGSDFTIKDGFRMYHGEVVPGFPQHPHRGFETVTVARRGFIDHSDSLGATARFGHGDVQWMTAGKGIVHSEMFPLVERTAPNPVELFQIWLNLPAEDKMVEPHFTMLWADQVPTVIHADADGHKTSITVIAGGVDGARPPAPPPKSWAARLDSHVAIWSIKMEPGAKWQLPAGPKGANRTLYFFRGSSITLAGKSFGSHGALRLQPTASIEIQNGDQDTELLLLQGKPIAQPVVQYGPFVMNSRPQIQQAVADYQRTQFGGWPWPDDAPVHARDAGRFARHADGRIEKPQTEKS